RFLSAQKQDRDRGGREQNQNQNFGFHTVLSPTRTSSVCSMAASSPLIRPISEPISSELPLALSASSTRIRTTRVGTPSKLLTMRAKFASKRSRARRTS